MRVNISFAGVIGAAALAVAFASMIFAGDLAPYIAIGITVLFVGNLIHTLGAYLGSALPAMVSGVQDSPAVIMAVTAAAIQSGMPGAGSEAKLYTVLAAIMLAGLFTGAVCLLLGKFKLGSLVAYLPYPVMAGFLAGTGGLLVLGALQVMTGQPITFNRTIHPTGRSISADLTALPMYRPAGTQRRPGENEKEEKQRHRIAQRRVPAESPNLPAEPAHLRGA